MMFARLLLSVFALSLVPPAFAQNYPTKPVKIVVGYSPGGTADFVVRLLAPGLQERLKQSIVVENRPGASGTIGANLVAKATPDGYTIYFGSSTEFTLVQYVMAELPYDPLGDFSPVVIAASSPTIIVVNPSVPVDNTTALLALAKSKGGLPYGSPGPGSNANIAFDVLQADTKIPFTHVAYKGGGPAASDLVAGQLPTAVVSAVSIIAHMRAGKARALAVLQEQRSSLMPDVPTFKESTGIDIMNAATLFQFMAPAKTPNTIVSRLEDAILDVLADPVVRERLNQATLEVLALPTSASSARLRDLSSYNENAIKRAGIRAKSRQ